MSILAVSALSISALAFASSYNTRPAEQLFTEANDKNIINAALNISRESLISDKLDLNELGLALKQGESTQDLLQKYLMTYNLQLEVCNFYRELLGKEGITSQEELKDFLEECEKLEKLQQENEALAHLRNQLNLKEQRKKAIKMMLLAAGAEPNSEHVKSFLDKVENGEIDVQNLESLNQQLKHLESQGALSTDSRAELHSSILNALSAEKAKISRQIADSPSASSLGEEARQVLNQIKEATPSSREEVPLTAPIARDVSLISIGGESALVEESSQDIASATPLLEQANQIPLQQPSSGNNALPGISNVAQVETIQNPQSEDSNHSDAPSKKSRDLASHESSVSGPTNLGSSEHSNNAPSQTDPTSIQSENTTKTPEPDRSKIKPEQKVAQNTQAAEAEQTTSSADIGASAPERSVAQKPEELASGDSEPQSPNLGPQSDLEGPIKPSASSIGALSSNTSDNFVTSSLSDQLNTQPRSNPESTKAQSEFNHLFGQSSNLMGRTTTDPRLANARLNTTQFVSANPAAPTPQLSPSSAAPTESVSNTSAVAANFSFDPSSGQFKNLATKDVLDICEAIDQVDRYLVLIGEQLNKGVETYVNQGLSEKQAIEHTIFSVKKLNSSALQILDALSDLKRSKPQLYETKASEQCPDHDLGMLYESVSYLNLSKPLMGRDRKTPVVLLDENNKALYREQEHLPPSALRKLLNRAIASVQDSPECIDVKKFFITNRRIGFERKKGIEKRRSEMNSEEAILKTENRLARLYQRRLELEATLRGSQYNRIYDECDFSHSNLARYSAEVDSIPIHVSQNEILDASKLRNNELIELLTQIELSKKMDLPYCELIRSYARQAYTMIWPAHVSQKRDPSESIDVGNITCEELDKVALSLIDLHQSGMNYPFSEAKSLEEIVQRSDQENEFPATHYDKLGQCLSNDQQTFDTLIPSYQGDAREPQFADIIQNQVALAKSSSASNLNTPSDKVGVFCSALNVSKCAKNYTGGEETCSFLGLHSTYVPKVPLDRHLADRQDSSGTVSLNNSSHGSDRYSPVGSRYAPTRDFPIYPFGASGSGNADSGRTPSSVNIPLRTE